MQVGVKPNWHRFGRVTLQFFSDYAVAEVVVRVGQDKDGGSGFGVQQLLHSVGRDFGDDVGRTDEGATRSWFLGLFALNVIVCCDAP